MATSKVDLIGEVDRMAFEMRSLYSKYPLPESITQSEISGKTLGGQYENVTAYDCALSTAMLKTARSVFPQSYSEEELPLSRPVDQFLWQIDPLDGTDELIAGKPNLCGVSAALFARQADGSYHPEAGILFLPKSDLMIVGDTFRREVTYLIKGQKKFSPRRLSNSVLGYTRQIDPNERAESYYQRLGKSLDKSASSIGYGGASHAFVSLLMGDVSVICFNYDYSKEWDVSAAEPILKVVGGTLSDLDGVDFVYEREDRFNRNGFLASIDFSREQLLREITPDLLTIRLKS